ncbi:Aldehyde/histidinol dehydrogenase [Schizophyllum amplum]|uniref:Aldehyde/histidinol dehydrogenase n=1 Tax=Schizophyllum amplum TaxID=97359 RepID=A0A550BYC7_9AGAR|nr:Aldehyde/histidinol dehydrogenase [Auriculariopsis ampla]
MAFSETTQTTISPATQQPVYTRDYPSPAAVTTTLDSAASAASRWAAVPLAQRQAAMDRFLAVFEAADKDELARELTAQMGRPLKQNAGEFNGFLGRARYLASVAAECLADMPIDEAQGNGFTLKRRIKKVPLGVVLLIAPWNYPYLTTVNALVPALLAGNAVILKPSPQTPLVSDVFTVLHLTPNLVKQAMRHPAVGFVSFTGSVAGGRDVARVAAGYGDDVGEIGIKHTALELGGKDPAYVRADADLDYVVPELVDGAMYNSGQSCCGVERIYVHTSLYPAFVAKFADFVKKEYKLGDPMAEGVNLGPVISNAAKKRIEAQVAEAVASGATALIPASLFPAADDPNSAYVAPQVLVGCTAEMEVVKEETFGPVVPILEVADDAEAIKAMNDSRYGLTASIWTNDADAFAALEPMVEAGTVFMNRADFLDPALAWVGVKDSGRGVSLSYDQVTRPKSVHMKVLSGK